MNYFLEKYIGELLLLISLIIGVLTVSEYGMGWDELIQRRLGIINANYVFKGDTSLFNFQDRDYGVAFELPLVVMEKLLGLEDSRSIYISRHLATHVFFLFSAYCGFRLIHFLYNNRFLAAIGFLMLTLHPRIYGQSFMNAKDIPFMGMFLVSFYSIALAFHRKTVFSFLIAGISIGILCNLRILGVLPLVGVITCLLIDIVLFKEEGIPIKSGLKLLSVFIVASVLTVYMTWPYLWPNPIGHFLEAFSNMSKFRTQFKILFQGEIIHTATIPWYYFPTWFSITTPIIFLILGLCGIIILLIDFIKEPFSFIKNNKVRNNLFYLVCFFVPILAVILLKSVLYDGWRHLYFVYPSFVLMAIYGLNFFFQTKMKKVVLMALLINFGMVSFFTIKNFPVEYIYFNELVNQRKPEYLRSQYELDYWAASAKQALEYILQKDKSDNIVVFGESIGGYNNFFLLKKEDRKRLRVTSDVSEANYVIAEYRMHPHDYEQYKGKEWHSFKIKNNTYSIIFKN